MTVTPISRNAGHAAGEGAQVENPLPVVLTCCFLAVVLPENNRPLPRLRARFRSCAWAFEEGGPLLTHGTPFLDPPGRPVGPAQAWTVSDPWRDRGRERGSGVATDRLCLAWGAARARTSAEAAMAMASAEWNARRREGVLTSMVLGGRGARGRSGVACER